MVDEDTLKKAYSHSIHNKSEVARSDLCGCFYCKKTFRPDEVKSTTDKTGRKGRTPPDQTVICPFCGIDAVLGSESGYPLTLDFLEEMYRYGFKHSASS
jgi:hypothetical protein